MPNAPADVPSETAKAHLLLLLALGRLYRARHPEAPMADVRRHVETAPEATASWAALRAEGVSLAVARRHLFD